MSKKNINNIIYLKKKKKKKCSHIREDLDILCNWTW